MSHIKRLKLKGFKSFANPTILNFEKGFNTVVGANGSGKSNVFDAMCFVLGRLSSKELRTEKLGNLVFNGGKHSKPAQEAEVSIYLSNENKELLNVDLEEIKITRIVKKDGQSKYLLNNNRVTRTEIVEVLGRAGINPDGYNIILQGDIVRIVNMSPIERRELIEEISNISGYEEKREKGIKKLEKVETDLKDADLLMEEKTKYLRELKSEKEQAERYHKVKADLRYDNLLLLKARIIRNETLKKSKQDELQKSEELLLENKKKLDEFEKESKDIDFKISDLEKTIEVKSHQDFISVTNKITQIDAEISKLKEKKSELRKQSEELKIKNKGLESNILNNKKEIKKFEEEISILKKDKSKLDSDLAEIDAEIKLIKKEVSPEGFKELEDIDKQVDEINLKKSDKTLIRQDNAIQIEKLNTKIEHLEADLNRIDNLNKDNKDQVKDLEKNRVELKKLIMKISELVNKNSETSSKLNKLEQEYSVVIEEHSRLRMKADASRDLIASNKAVEMVLKFKSKDPKVHGTVAELATVPGKYGEALEKTAGKGLFNIVVEDDATAVKYINYLKENKIGSATFLPLNKVKAKYNLDDSVLNKKGVIDYALNLIKFDKRYENIFHLIFSDTLVIENITDAKGVGIGDYKMVTLDGDLVGKSGAMSGGHNSRRGAAGAFRDDKIISKVDELERKISGLKNSIDLLRGDKDDSERELYDLRHRKIEVESDVAKLEKLLSIEGMDTSKISSEIKNYISDKAVIEGSLKKIDREISEFNSSLEKLNLRKASLRSASNSKGGRLSNLSKLEERRDILKDKIIELNSKIGTKEIQINNVLKPEMVNMEKILKEGDESMTRIIKNISDIDENLKKLDVELKEFKEKEKELSKGYKEIIAKRDKLKEEKVKLEARYEKEFSKFDSVKEKAAQLRYAISEFETLNKTLSEELEHFYVEIKSELQQKESEENSNNELESLIDRVESRLSGTPIDVKELQTRVNNLKTKLNSFGSINMKAVEIYDKLKEEFDILLEKRETLNVEKAEILQFIAEIDEKKKERFMETFEKLRKNFVEIFSKLSTKGVVELNVENEKDLFNSGVEIKVKMSEKNYLDIKSLSGGEKTITAVAFIFAVQEFSPASFYILDEIDAALDIVNCEKLGKLVKEYAHKAQYIVVSHSEYFIQSAEIIYGVTMDSNKVSNVVSLDLRDTKDYLDEGQPKSQT